MRGKVCCTVAFPVSPIHTDLFAACLRRILERASVVPSEYPFLAMSPLPPLTTATLWAILKEEIPDETVNQLVWHYLGYRFDDTTHRWDNRAVEPTWVEKYPEPPDFIESRPATVQLTRSIPKENKQLLKTQLGFKGYSVDQLVPRLTRRATMTNWLLSYMALNGIPLAD